MPSRGVYSRARILWASARRCGYNKNPVYTNLQCPPEPPAAPPALPPAPKSPPLEVDPDIPLEGALVVDGGVGAPGGEVVGLYCLRRENPEDANIFNISMERRPEDTSNIAAQCCRTDLPPKKVLAT